MRGIALQTDQFHTPRLGTLDESVREEKMSSSFAHEWAVVHARRQEQQSQLSFIISTTISFVMVHKPFHFAHFSIGAT